MNKTQIKKIIGKRLKKLVLVTLVFELLCSFTFHQLRDGTATDLNLFMVIFITSIFFVIALIANFIKEVLIDIQITQQSENNK